MRTKSKTDYKKVAKLKPHPIFKDLPQSLKDPKCFKEVERKIFLATKSDHKHKNMGAYAKCERCQLKLLQRKKLMKEMGFDSFAQYLEWKKIMGMMLEIKGLRAKK